MGKEFGPWVRHDWCARCARTTEQTRWLRRFIGEPGRRTEQRMRCNECHGEVTGVAS